MDIKNIVNKIEDVAKDLETTPARMSRAEFLEAVVGSLTEWDLRKYGGYSSIIASHFMPTEKDLPIIQEHKNHISYVRGLEKKLGNIEAFKNQVTKELTNILSKIKVEENILDKSETKTYLNSLSIDRSSKADRSIVSLWSDQHFGSNITRDEMGGKNEYNWEIGARRLGMLVEQIATYKIEKRGRHEELVILLDGDNIGGVIHNQEGPDFDLMIHQVCGTLSYYIQAFTTLSAFFPKIRIVCQPGNHGRVQHKSSKDRALHQKYDSFENIIFYALSSKFAYNKNITFEVSKAPFSTIKIQGHRVYMTHGDTVFNLGNVSNNIRMASLEHQVNRINAEELRAGQKAYELFCMGHVHHPMVTELDSGARLAINGALVGTDQFALGIGIQSSNPSQLLWESTKQHVLGDVRIVNVGDADSVVRYEHIIRPYNYELAAAKEI
jgi:hypothetical protein